jgi:hypothetical protein
MEYHEIYFTWAKRIPWLDNDGVPGPSPINFSWYCKSPRSRPRNLACMLMAVVKSLASLGLTMRIFMKRGRKLSSGSKMNRILSLSRLSSWSPEVMKRYPLVLKLADEPISQFSTVTGSCFG